MIVCDTNVVSEPMKAGGANDAVVNWLDRQPAGALYLSTIVLSELHAGIRARSPGRKTDELASALSVMLAGIFHSRILVFDQRCAECFGNIYAATRAAGEPVDYADMAIGATARAHGFAVASRNVTHFAHAGVKIINPWEA